VERRRVRAVNRENFLVLQREQALQGGGNPEGGLILFFLLFIIIIRFFYKNDFMRVRASDFFFQD